MKEIGYSELNLRIGKVGLKALSFPSGTPERKFYQNRLTNLEKIWRRRYMKGYGEKSEVKRVSIKQLTLFNYEK